MIVNSNTTPENTEIKSQPKTTEAMAPGLNEVKPTDVATSEADSKQNPDPPVKAKAVVDYFKSLYISKGREFDEDVLYKYAQRKDLKSFIRKFHVIGGFSDSMPTQEESDAIYNTWLDTSVVEKKNPTVNGVQEPAKNPQEGTSLEQPSIVSGGSPSLVSPGVLSLSDEEVRNDNEDYVSFQEPAELTATQVRAGLLDRNSPELTTYFTQIRGNGAMMDGDKYLSHVVENIPISLINLDENDAQLAFQKILRPYNFKVKQDRVGTDALEVIRPDGRSVKLRLFTPLYKRQLLETGETEEQVAATEKKRFEEFTKELYQGAGGSFIDGVAAGLANSTNIVSDIRDMSSQYVALGQEELSDLALYTGQRTSSFFTPTSIFKPEEASRAITNIKNSLRSRMSVIRNTDFREQNAVVQDGTNVGQDRRQMQLPQENTQGFQPRSREVSNDEIIEATNDKLDAMITHMRSRKERASSIIGSGLQVSGVWKNIDLRNIDELKALNQAGLNVTDIPTGGILIDGQASTFNTLQEILTKPSSRNDVIRGKIEVSLGDPSAYGFLGPYISAANKLIERNEAHKIEHKGKAELVIASEWVEDLFQGVVLSGAEILGNSGVLISDTLEMFGMDKENADALIFGGYGLPVGRFPSLEAIRSIRADALPLWNTDITDASSFGELMHLANEPAATSFPYFASFALNPTFGLSVVGVSSYGGTLDELEQRKKLVNQQYESGVPLTEEQNKVLNLTKWDARGIALSTALTETAITRFFTFRYFKQMQAARNFKGARTTQNALKISQEFAKRQTEATVGSFTGTFGKRFGQSLAFGKRTFKQGVQALKYELPEENLVAASNYVIKDAWGIDKLEYKTFSKMLKNTSFHTAFSSLTMSRFANAGRNKALQKAVNNQVKRNIVLPGDRDIATQFLQVDAAIQRGRLDPDIDQTTPGFVGMEAHLDFLSIELQARNIRKQELVDQMTPADKEVFLETIYRLEQTEDILNSPDSDNNTKRNVIDKQIPEFQKKLNSILTKYPHELGYEYLDKQTKADLDNMAVAKLEQEFKEADITFYNIDREMISKKAGELFVEQVKARNIKNAEKFLPADGYTVVDPGKYMSTVTTEDIGKTNLQLELNDAFSTLENLARMTEGTQDDTTVEGGMVSRNTDITNQILGRLKKYNIDNNFLSTLNKEHAGHIVQFLKDLRTENKIPAFGYVTAVLDAHDIAIDVSSKSPKKIKIFDYKGRDEATTFANLYKKINAWSQKNITVRAGFGTGDIILKTLFRDGYVGEKVYTLFQNMNRKVSVQTNRIDGLGSAAFVKFKRDVIASNKKNNTNTDTDINSVKNSYGIGFAMGFFRKSGVLENDVDSEFVRWKRLVTQELDLRRTDFENATKEDIELNTTKTRRDKKEFEEKYRIAKEVYDEFGIEIAENAEQLNIPDAIVNFVTDLQAAQPGDLALQRIRDFGGSTNNETTGKQQPFVDGTYVPISLINTNGGFSGTKISSDSGMNIVDARQLKETTLPQDLSEDLRLNLGMSAKNAYSSTRGGAIDVDARLDAVTIKYLLENPIFKGKFESEAEYEMIADYFRTKLDDFNTIVNEGSQNKVDIGTKAYKQTFGKFTNALYGGISSISLARVSQRSSQYYSALAGTAPYLKSPAAKAHLNAHGVKFVFGISGASTGTAKKTQIGKLIRDGYFGRGDLSNIYDNSRTGLRNALKAEFALGPNAKIPADYFLKYLGVQDTDGKILAGLNPAYTVNEFLDYISKGSEISLDLFLASADRSAANAAFEAHYIDYRVQQGEGPESRSQNNAWWKNENENPNIEAINYADGLIAQTMRQTEKTSEAGLYGGGEAKRSAVRMAFPFQKFITNARANFGNQYAITQDPNVPESQKREARSAMEGILKEVVAFNVVKLGSGLAMLKGFSVGILGFGADDKDISKYGGTTQLVGADLAPIEDRAGVLDKVLKLGGDDYQDATSSAVVTQKSTKEGQGIAAYQAMYNLTDAAYAIEALSRKYENKFTVAKDRSILTRTIQDAFVAVQPTPMFMGSEDMLFHGFNMLLQETGLVEEGDEFFDEYISTDLEKATTKGGFIDFLSENLGIYSIGAEAFSKLKQAQNLYYDNEFLTDEGDYGAKTNYIGAGPSDPMTEKLKQSVKTLMFLRLMAMFAPVPKGDFNKTANYLQRAIEAEFKSSTPNPKMTEEN